MSLAGQSRLLGTPIRVPDTSQGGQETGRGAQFLAWVPRDFALFCRPPGPAEKPETVYSKVHDPELRFEVEHGLLEGRCGLSAEVLAGGDDPRLRQGRTVDRNWVRAALPAGAARRN